MSEQDGGGEARPGDDRCRGYRPISDYAAIGNLRTVALVARDGSIDWCCLPELDAPSVFGALLDARRGGRFRVAPAGGGAATQRYLGDTNVLETRFETDGGRVCVVDFMPLRGSIISADDPQTSPVIYRLVRCEAGEVSMEVEWSPRFDYARAVPDIRRTAEGFVARAGEAVLALGPLPEGVGRIEDGPSGPVARAVVPLRAGERLSLATRYGAEETGCSDETCQAALEATVDAWRGWVGAYGGFGAFEGAWRERVTRSGLVLKLLTHPDSGAVAAAATTSLPERIGGVRNWDYRFSWIRDAAFTAQALVSLGHRAEALDFINWAHRVSEAKGPSGMDVQIMYGLHGETDLQEIELDHLEGYCGSRPVRIGNGAAGQRQLDLYGELLASALELVRIGGRLEPHVWEFLSTVADRACAVWREPDCGIWEIRGEPRHFVHSKVMVWVALDRAITLAGRFQLRGDVDRWRREREAIREVVLSEGYDPDVGAFVQSFGSKHLDASNLVIPVVEFLPPDDPRVLGTIDRTLERLTDRGVVYRYLSDDGLPGGEGAFGLTTFWMVDALTLCGRLEEARELFEGMLGRVNHVGLYAEEFDPETGAFLGNFPQAFTHVGLINSALYLARAEGREPAAPAPIGSREHKAEVDKESEEAG